MRLLLILSLLLCTHLAFAQDTPAEQGADAGTTTAAADTGNTAGTATAGETNTGATEAAAPATADAGNASGTATAGETNTGATEAAAPATGDAGNTAGTANAGETNTGATEAAAPVTGDAGNAAGTANAGETNAGAADTTAPATGNSGNPTENASNAGQGAAGAGTGTGASTGNDTETTSGEEVGTNAEAAAGAGNDTNAGNAIEAGNVTDIGAASGNASNSGLALSEECRSELQNCSDITVIGLIANFKRCEAFQMIKNCADNITNATCTQAETNRLDLNMCGMDRLIQNSDDPSILQGSTAFRCTAKISVCLTSRSGYFNVDTLGEYKVFYCAASNVTAANVCFKTELDGAACTQAEVDQIQKAVCSSCGLMSSLLLISAMLLFHRMTAGVITTSS